MRSSACSTNTVPESDGPTLRSVFVEHALDLIHVRRLGQRKRQQERRLLRAQVVANDHAGLIPVVATHDAAFADARALHHHGAALLDDLYKLLVETVGCASADARDHDAFGAKSDHRTGHARTRSG